MTWLGSSTTYVGVATTSILRTVPYPGSYPVSVSSTCCCIFIVPLVMTHILQYDSLFRAHLLDHCFCTWASHLVMAGAHCSSWCHKSQSSWLMLPTILSALTLDACGLQVFLFFSKFLHWLFLWKFWSLQLSTGEVFYYLLPAWLWRFG